MSLEEIFNDREAFKQKIVTQIQSDLEKFGIEIKAANLKVNYFNKKRNYQIPNNQIIFLI
jgi:uncharacterized membrane protein YqiK